MKNWNTCKKKKTVTVARLTDNILIHLHNKDIAGRMHPVGQILNCDESRESPNGGSEHIHAPIYVIYTPRLCEDDENKGDKVIFFIDNYISCSILN